MSVDGAVRSDRELRRLLQMGVVMAEVVEVRADQHRASLRAAEAEVDPVVHALLDEASEGAAEHRERLEELIDDLDAETVAFDRIAALVEERYVETPAGSFDDVLYDHLHAVESAFKLYDDLIAAVEASDATFDVDREPLLETLADLRDDAADGVRQVTALMGEDG